MAQHSAPISINSRRPLSGENATALVVHELSFAYADKEQIFDRVSFSAHPGEHIVIVGPSGCGKTTLLKCLSGKLSAQSGRVDAFGRIAIIHQDLRLITERSAFVNVLHGALREASFLSSLIGFSKQQRQKAMQLLERVGLGHRAHFPVKKLSGGEKQRVAIARALMQEPAILLADEPVSGLDDFNSHSVLRLLKELSLERRMTVVSVLHNRSLAAAYGDNVLELDAKLSRCAVTDHTCNQDCPTVDGARQCVLTQPSPFTEPPRHLSSTLTAAVILLVLALGAQSRDLFTDVRSEFIVGNVVSFLGQLFPTSLTELREIPWLLLLDSLVETLRMAFLATVLSAAISLPLAVLSARNVGFRFVAGAARSALNVVRTIPAIVWALLCVAALGLGPLAGVVALTAYSTGYLTKFFYEAFENVDPKPISALREIGASSASAFVHGIWPAAKPALLSSMLFMAEYNVRSASILGIVGAGGIGFYIKEYIDYRFFPAMTASLVMILAVVLVLDWASGALRRRLVRE